MLPFLLYLLAALFTGRQILQLISWTFWGAPFTPTMLLAFIGSFALIFTAFLSVFRFQRAVRIATFALLGEWTFYAPALLLNQYRMARETIPYDPIYDVIALFPTVLLVVATLYTLFVWYWLRQRQVATWYVPYAGAGKTTRSIAIAVGTVAIVMCCVYRP
jgi:hypothetical protein